MAVSCLPVACTRQQACEQTSRGPACMSANTCRQTQAVCGNYSYACGSLSQASKHKLPGGELAIARKQPLHCLLSLLLLRSYNHHHPGAGRRQRAVRSCLPQLL